VKEKCLKTQSGYRNSRAMVQMSRVSYNGRVFEPESGKAHWKGWKWMAVQQVG